MIKRIMIIVSVVFGILLIPFIGMQLSTEVNWHILDFLIMGALLFSIGLLLDFTFRKVKTVHNKLILCFIILFGFFLIWAELAVGIFGTPFAGN